VGRPGGPGRPDPAAVYRAPPPAVPDRHASHAAALARRAGQAPLDLSAPGTRTAAYRVGAENAVTSCDLRVLVDQAAELVAWSDADVVVGRRDMGPAVGWLLAEGPVRPVGVVVIDVFAEDVVEMSPAGDEDAVGALAPRAGDPPLADRVRARRLDRRLNPNLL